MDEEAAKNGVDLAVAWVGLGGALAGTLVGGVITIAVSCLAQRGLDKQAERARRQHVADRRFDVHREFLTRANKFVDDALSVWNALYHDHEQSKRDATYEAYLESWRRYYETSTGPQLTGPPDLAAKSREFADAITNYSNALDAWFLDGSHPNIRQSKDSECKALQKTVDVKRTQYVGAAQSAFSD